MSTYFTIECMILDLVSKTVDCETNCEFSAAVMEKAKDNWDIGSCYLHLSECKSWTKMANQNT